MPGLVPGIHALLAGCDLKQARWMAGTRPRPCVEHAGSPVELLDDPMFMAVAVIGVCLLGISKGGFLGLGVMALPLMSLFVPPLQAAAIILPTAIAQDFLTLWVYRREWSAWNLKIMLPSMFVGMFSPG